MGLFSPIARMFGKTTFSKGFGTSAGADILEGSAKSGLLSRSTLEATGEAAKAGASVAKNNWGKGLVGYLGVQGFQGFSSISAAVQSVKALAIPVALVGGALAAGYLAFKGLFGKKEQPQQVAPQGMSPQAQMAMAQGMPSQGISFKFFQLESFRVLDERRWNALGELITMSEATIKLNIGKKRVMTVAEGNGPVNALDKALRNSLSSKYPVLSDIKLIDYKVRILSPQDATAAVTRVMIESQDAEGHSWSTIGVSANVIDASFNALKDSINYRLLRE